MSETMWKPIETAPKDGTVVDLWGKRWNPRSDDFQYRRFTNYQWGEKRPYEDERGYMRSAGGREQWVRASEGTKPMFEPVAKEGDWFPSEWYATHWMPLPTPPEGGA